MRIFYYETVIDEIEKNRNKEVIEYVHTCKYCESEIYINKYPCIFYHLVSVPNFVCSETCLTQLTKCSIVPNWWQWTNPEPDDPFCTFESKKI